MNHSRFLFHAYAAGLNGRIHRPFEEVLEVQAPSALPPTGGVSKGSSKDVRLRDLFQCASVTSQSTGEFHPATDTYESRVTAVVEQFRIGQTVTVDLIRSQVHSSHPRYHPGQASIVMDGSAIINLKINGTPIELENLSPLFTEFNTYQKLRDRHRENAEFRERIQQYTMVGRFEEIGSQLHHYFPFCRRKPTDDLHETRNATILPLFRVMTTSGPGFTAVENVIEIENFGRLHLGELIVSPYERRVTGLHVNLGSPIGGDITACAVGANGGETDPPPPPPGN